MNSVFTFFDTVCVFYVYRHEVAPKGHPFCPSNHKQMYPMRQELLNKYTIDEFPDFMYDGKVSSDVRRIAIGLISDIQRGKKV